MALARRLRSSTPLLQQILGAESILARRSAGNPSASLSQHFRNYATDKSSKEANVKSLPAEEEKELKQTLQDIIGHGKTVNIEQKVDPSILGGLVVEFGQKVFDMSIKTRAKQMERFLRDPINFDSL